MRPVGMILEERWSGESHPAPEDGVPIWRAHDRITPVEMASKQHGQITFL